MLRYPKDAAKCDYIIANFADSDLQYVYSSIRV